MINNQDCPCCRKTMIFVMVALSLVFAINVGSFLANQKIMKTIGIIGNEAILLAPKLDAQEAKLIERGEAMSEDILAVTAELQHLQSHIEDMNGDIRRLEGQVKGLPGQVKKAVSEGISFPTLQSGGGG